MTNINNVPSLFIVKSALQLGKAYKIIKKEKLQVLPEECYEFGKSLGKNLLNLKDEIKEKKEIFSNPSTLLEYHGAFPTTITNFFSGLIEILLKRQHDNAQAQRKKRAIQKA